MAKLRNALLPPEETESKSEPEERKEQLTQRKQQERQPNERLHEIMPAVLEQVKRYLIDSPTTVAQWLTPAVQEAIAGNRRQIAEGIVPLLPPSLGSREPTMTRQKWDRLLEILIAEVNDRLEASEHRTQQALERIVFASLIDAIAQQSGELVEIILPELVPPLQAQLKQALQPYLQQQERLLSEQLQQEIDRLVAQRLESWRDEWKAALSPTQEAIAALPSVEELQPEIAAQVQSQLSQQLSQQLPEYVQTQIAGQLPDTSQWVQQLTPTLESLIEQRVEQVQEDLLEQVQLSEAPDLQRIESAMLNRLQGSIDDRIQSALAELPPAQSAIEPIKQPTPEELMAAIKPALEQFILSRIPPPESSQAPPIAGTVTTKKRLPGTSISKRGWIIVAAITAIVLLSVGWLFYRSVRATRLSEKLTQQLTNTPELAPYRLRARVKGDIVHLSGQLPNLRLQQMAEEAIAAHQPDLFIETAVELLPAPLLPEEIQAEVTRVEAALDRLDGISISADYNSEQANVNITGTVIQEADGSKIAQAFAAIPGIRSVTNTVKVQPPDIPIRVYFSVNSAQLATVDLRAKIIPLVSLLKKYPELRINIVGYISPAQEAKKGIGLSRQRAENVKKVLMQQGIDPKRLQVEAIAYPPPDVNPKQPDWLKRATVFYPVSGL
ncbi:OmpA family protein [Roseofilum casamattae]|uniref:OmpA family protein n=1 Tax=Roseofilum casamattae BLCC-M143 TaxID=3022442 RepID=A0ABT7BTR5_9CYAN|nr:OmpA family protein [Roseofilum casamattae]MDJ1182583.1 OmpA family protein [Roseofilum casamattae BLCC-M143]